MRADQTIGYSGDHVCGGIHRQVEIAQPSFELLFQPANQSASLVGELDSNHATVFLVADALEEAAFGDPVDKSGDVGFVTPELGGELPERW